MGYYSQVALCVSEQVEIPAEIRAIMEEIGFEQVGSYEGSRLFMSPYLKWYDSFAEISCLDEWMLLLEDENYRFLRIGEDMDDTESRGVFYGNPFNLGIDRMFSYDNLDDTL